MKQNNSTSRYLLLLLFIFPIALSAQSVITGTLTSESNGETIPFANVIEKGTSNGTTTDIDGKFSIEVAGLPATLEFSSLGFATQEVTATSNSLNVNPLGEIKLFEF